MLREAGYKNISLDLMYGLPGQTMDMWKRDVEEVMSLQVPHLSAYSLQWEEGTPLYRMLERGEVAEASDEVSREMYEYIVRTAAMYSMEHYEVSNFALPGQYSKHNSSYWNDTPYIGLGAGAHSYDGKSRKWNISHIDSYIQQASAHTLLPELETLTEEQHHTEQIMLGLRTNQGITIDKIDISKAEPYIAQGLLLQHNNRIYASTKGFHILNRIIEDLI